MRRRSAPSRAFLGALVLAVVAVTVVLVVRARGDRGAELPDDVGVVEYVVDGDTIDVAIGGREERVRLIGINTPETHVESGPPECYGMEAADFTRSVLPAGTEVRLTRDAVGRDDYGRLLAYVHRRADDLFVNNAIIAAGYARPLTIGPNDAYATQFVAAATAAEASDLGLWGACAG